MEVDKENEIKKERKERISRFEMHRLEKGIYPSGSKRSFEVSPSGSFLCCRNLVLKVWFPDPQHPHHLGTC